MKILNFLLFVYQSAISPLIHLLCGPGFGCRFEPSCSEYAKESFQSWGVLRGTLLTLGRLCRCHPFAKAGYDPVPRVIDRCYKTTH